MNYRAIDLWKIETFSESDVVQNYLQFLSEDEKEKSCKFRFQKDRHEYIISRGFLRTVLSSYINTSPGNLNFSYGPYGKPYLSDNSIKLMFNLSHSYGTTLIAVNQSDELGLDLEKVKNIDDHYGLAEKLYTENEIKLLDRADNNMSIFYKIWARKEAIIKAIGKGLSISLNSIDVSDPDNILYKNSLNLNETEINNCRLYTIDAPDGFEAALACFGEKKEIRYKN